MKARHEISLLGSFKETLNKCCIDPLRSPRLSGGIHRGGPEGETYTVCTNKRLIVENNAQERFIDLNIPLGVFDETMFSESIHKEIHTGSSCPNHFRQH